jgi:hypothetical protein
LGLLSVEKVVVAEMDIKLHAKASLSIHGGSTFQPTGAADTTASSVTDLS